MTAAAPPFTLLVATGRPAIRYFFSGLAAREDRPFTISYVQPALPVTGEMAEQVRAASAVVLDLAPTDLIAIRLCQEMRAMNASLRILGLVCCSRAVDPVHTQALLAAGAGGVIDLQSTAEDVLRALETIARGDTVLSLGVGTDALLVGDVVAVAAKQAPPAEIGRLTETQAQMLQLLTHGLTDRQIGAELHLSPDTVKHYLVRLRKALRVKNRAALAAWAGSSGFYRRVAG